MGALFDAAMKLIDRDEWIGWTRQQRAWLNFLPKLLSGVDRAQSPPRQPPLLAHHFRALRSQTRRPYNLVCNNALKRKCRGCEESRVILTLGMRGLLVVLWHAFFQA